MNKHRTAIHPPDWPSCDEMYGFRGCDQDICNFHWRCTREKPLSIREAFVHWIRELWAAMDRHKEEPPF